MPIVNTFAKAAVKPFPRVISPKAHAILKYVAAGSMLGGAAWLWKRNKRASLAALLCAGAEVAANLATDYEGAGRKPIEFGARRSIDLGLAAVVASVPEFMEINDDSEKKFFLAEGALITVISELTRYSGGRPSRARTKKGLKAA